MEYPPRRRDASEGVAGRELSRAAATDAGAKATVLR
jgi:hypothetical protein